MSLHETYIKHALNLAEQAQKQGEVPIGALIVYQNKIIAQGWNRPIISHDPTAHAEIIAIRQAAQILNNYRLVDTSLYVTLQPCAMCATAMIHARIKNLIFGAFDPKSASDIIFSSQLSEQLNHRIEVQGGVLEQECSAALKEFFQLRR